MGKLFEKYGNFYFLLSMIAVILSITLSIRNHFLTRRREILQELEEKKLKA